jgi:hypothetical protein
VPCREEIREDFARRVSITIVELGFPIQDFLS